MMTSTFKKAMRATPLVLRIIVEGVVLALVTIPPTIAGLAVSLVLWLISLGHITLLIKIIRWLESPLSESWVYKHSAHLQWFNRDERIMDRIKGRR